MRNEAFRRRGASLLERDARRRRVAAVVDDTSSEGKENAALIGSPSRDWQSLRRPIRVLRPRTLSQAARLILRSGAHVR